MTYRDDDGYLDEPEAEEPPPRRLGATIVLLMVLAGTGIGSALVWHAFGGTMSALPGRAGAPAQVAVQDTVPRKDFESYQQATAEELKGKGQMLDAQQAQIRALAEQIAQLATKIQSLERRATEVSQAQASVPKPAAKKPPAPRAPAAISTGGAPLPLSGAKQ
jgi:hypothetical protein